MTIKQCRNCVFLFRNGSELPCSECATYDWWNNENTHPYFQSAIRERVEEEEDEEGYVAVELSDVVLLVADLLRLADTLLNMIPDDIEEDMYGQRL